MDLEAQAAIPRPIGEDEFNPAAVLPYGLTIGHVMAVMHDFLSFLGFVNQQLASKGIQRLETMLMPANFSSLVGEFMSAGIPKYCPTLAKNQHHNGHPDLVPAGHFPNNAVQHSREGVEVKASRYLRGWQGHNPEAIWLMVFVFDSNPRAMPPPASRRGRFASSPSSAPSSPKPIGPSPVARPPAGAPSRPASSIAAIRR